MTRDEERCIEQFRERLGLLYFLKFSLACLAVWAFVYGSAVLALRATLQMPSLDLLWGLVSLPLPLLLAAYLAWRRMPSTAAIRALLDRHGRCGGLLMAGAEQPIGDWQQALPEVSQPGLRFRSGRSWALFGGGEAFLALALLLPQSLADFNGPTLDVEKETEQLAKQLDLLEKEKLLEKQRASDLKASLEQVRRDARGRDPIKTLESLDHLKDTAERIGHDAAESATRKMEDLGRAETFAEAMEKMAGKMDKNQLGEAMQMMANLAKRAFDERELMETGLDKETLEAIKNSTLSAEQTKKLLEKLLASGLDKETLDAMKKGTLTPEQAKKVMEKLKEKLKDGKDETMAKMSRLMKAKLINAEDLEKCDKAGKCDCEGLAAFLKENGASSDLTDALIDSEEGGRGGVSRGPGAAKLKFGDESTEEGAKFKEEELPQSEQQSLKDATLSGISTGTPQLGKEKAVMGKAGALSGAKVGGGSAATQTVLPRHRGTVERYFDRPTKK